MLSIELCQRVPIGMHVHDMVNGISIKLHVVPPLVGNTLWLCRTKHACAAVLLRRFPRLDALWLLRPVPGGHTGRPAV